MSEHLTARATSQGLPWPCRVGDLAGPQLGCRYLKLLLYVGLDRWGGVGPTIGAEECVCQLLKAVILQLCINAGAQGLDWQGCISHRMSITLGMSGPAWDGQREGRILWPAVQAQDGDTVHRRHAWGVCKGLQGSESCIRTLPCAAARAHQDAAIAQLDSIQITALLETHRPPASLGVRKRCI